MLKVQLNTKQPADIQVCSVVGSSVNLITSS